MLNFQEEHVSGLVSDGNGAMKDFSFESAVNSRQIAQSLRKVLFGNLGCEKETCMARPLRLSSVAVWVRKEKTQSDWQPERRKGLRGERKAESLGSNWFHCIHFVCVFPSVGNGHKSTCSFCRLCMIFQSEYHRDECFWFLATEQREIPCSPHSIWKCTQWEMGQSLLDPIHLQMSYICIDRECLPSSLGGELRDWGS